MTSLLRQCRMSATRSATSPITRYPSAMAQCMPVTNQMRHSRALPTGMQKVRRGLGAKKMPSTRANARKSALKMPVVTRSLTVRPFLRVVCMGILLCVSDGLTFVPAFAILRLEFANQT